jgi:hypothetical protein
VNGGTYRLAQVAEAGFLCRRLARMGGRCGSLGNRVPRPAAGVAMTLTGSTPGVLVLAASGRGRAVVASAIGMTSTLPTTATAMTTTLPTTATGSTSATFAVSAPSSTATSLCVGDARVAKAERQVKIS